MTFSWATTSLFFLRSWYPTNTHFMQHIMLAWDFPAYIENRTGTLGNVLSQACCYIYPAWATTSARCASQPQISSQEMQILSCPYILYFSLHGDCLLKIIIIQKNQTPSKQTTTQKLMVKKSTLMFILEGHVPQFRVTWESLKLTALQRSRSLEEPRLTGQISWQNTWFVSCAADFLQTATS